MDLDDTIVAVATPIGESGIGIVRISGSKALAVADKIFISKDGQKPSCFKTYTTHYGFIVSRLAHQPAKASKHKNWQTGNPAGAVLGGTLPFGAARQAGVIDEVILTLMRAPKSYTRQDIVEINCHGGIIPLRKTLELVLDSGARLSRPGEFTQRAFLNGRIDLPRAEAVLDIIRAKPILP